MAVFSGNELVIGLVLANWMILTGLGAFLGKFPLRIKKALPVIVSGLLLLSVLPFITTFLINFLKNKVFPVGALISMVQIVSASFLLLIPFCLISGFLFTFIVKSYSEIRNQNETGTIYGFESVGSIVGGLLSGLLFLSVFSSIESLLVLAIMNGSVIFLINLQKASVKWKWIPIFVVIPAFFLLFFHPEKSIRSFVYPNQEMVVSKDSPHGNLVITRREKMWSVFNNNVLLFDSENFMQNEEAVHFAMLQHPHPESVLLISGGLSGQIAEIRKYGKLSIDYVEDNRWLLALMKDTLKKMTDENLHVFASDPLRFIRNTSQTYDMAILNLPGPNTMQANRFFTLEFYQLLKQKLKPGAVFSFAIPSPPNYLNAEAIDLNSTLFATLKKVFQNVIILPGEENYFLASDGALTYNIAGAVQAKGIENRYVNQYYFDDALLKNRAENILATLNPAAKINQNLKPVSYNQQQAYWLSQFSGKYWIMAVLALLLALFIFFRGNTVSKTMFLTGFSASGMEILLLFGLQVFFGNIYLLTSFVFAGFMLGLAAGSFYGKSFSRSKKSYLSLTQILIGIFAAITSISLFSPEMAKLPEVLVYFLFLAATLMMGGFTGFQFSQASKNRTGSYADISGKTYSYDLMGSALGALAVSIFMVPKLGIFESVLTTSLLNIGFGFWLILKKR
jgi:spermidine synthase